MNQQLLKGCRLWFTICSILGVGPLGVSCKHGQRRNCEEQHGGPCETALVQQEAHQQTGRVTGIIAHQRVRSTQKESPLDKLFQSRPIPILGIVGFVLVLIVGLACCCCRRSTTNAAGSNAPNQASQDGADLSSGTPPQAQLSALKKQRMKAVIEWAAAKQRLEKIIESIIRCEAELREGAGISEPTEEEIQKRANDALQATDLLTERSLISALAFVMPSEDQRPKVLGALQEHASTAAAKAAAIGLEEAEHLCIDLQDVFSVQDNTKDAMFQAIGSIEIPTLSTLIASALAPAQLRLLHVTNQIRAFQVMFFTILSGSVLAWHSRSSCMVTPMQHSLFIWYIVDTSVCGFCLLVRLWTMQRVGAILGEVDDPPEVAAEDPVRALRIILDYYLTTGADALVSFDEVMKSCFYTLANWVTVFNCVWLLYGTDLVFNMPWHGCMAYGIIVLRVRVVFFHIFLLPILLSIVLFFLGSFLESMGFQQAVTKAADTIDELLGIGLPIASILVQSVLVRNKYDMAKLQLRRYELKRMELEIKQREMEQGAQELGQLQDATAEELERLVQERDSEAALSEEERRVRRIQAKSALITKADHALRRMNQAAMLVAPGLQSGARAADPAIQSTSDTPAGGQP